MVILQNLDRDADDYDCQKSDDNITKIVLIVKTVFMITMMKRMMITIKTTTITFIKRMMRMKMRMMMRKTMIMVRIMTTLLGCTYIYIKAGFH